MVTPLIPVLLAAVLGAGPVVLGAIEGLADAVAAALKLWAGRRSDLWGGRRKPFVLAGYGLSNLVRPLLGIAGSWPAVAALRSLDRVGKGLRTAPRDALLADATTPEIRGRAYGFHRAMDNGGAMAGALFAAACLAWTPLSLAGVILVSATELDVDRGPEINFATGIPTKTATAWYHKQLPTDLQSKPLKAVLAESENFAMNELLVALAKRVAGGSSASDRPPMP